MDVNKATNVGNVVLNRFGSVAQLTLSRPTALNALTWEMYQKLEEYLEILAEDSSIRVLIIRGDGEKALAAGTDINQFKNFTGEDGVDYERKIDRIINKLERFPKPTIAAVHGYAVGGGMIMATACDLRYATSKARFGAPMARTLGNCLSLDNYQRLVRELGAMKTKELLYTARIISAKEAFSNNFITDIFEEQIFFDKVFEIATKISGNAPSTVDATKEAFNRLNKNNSLTNSAQEFNDIISKVYGSKNFAEGVAAHMEKRSPVWQEK
ncbi:enoyl-CoA hydratase [Lentibacillus daqui]|uniref:enoyl-CoA hydratase n=1 Tax=Lentibacillus daqui TaxID=2911514 RepID=UPI0022B12CE2|nr:enoyl-CoA hydratase [Lentibacillus daqui]